MHVHGADPSPCFRKSKGLDVTIRRFMAGVLVTAFVAVSAVGLAVAQGGPAEIIAARQAGFKRTGDNAGEIKKALDGGLDLAPLAARAQDIADWSRKVPAMFPPGSDTGAKTAALPAIWTDRAGFETAAANLGVQADKLVQVIKAGDKAAVATQFGATSASCGACHRNFRART
jgi:cytochrome c556